MSNAKVIIPKALITPASPQTPSFVDGYSGGDMLFKTFNGPQKTVVKRRLPFSPDSKQLELERLQKVENTANVPPLQLELNAVNKKTFDSFCDRYLNSDL